MALDKIEYKDKYLDGDGLELVISIIDTVFARKNHGHGNITSGGTISGDVVSSIENGDTIIISDNNEGGKLVKGVTFDGSTTTKYLSQKGTWETIPSPATVNDGKLTFNYNGSKAGEFTANQSSGTTISISAATPEHSHGNITSGGTITSTGIEIANGDSIVVADSSASGKIEKALITFDGSTTNKFLSPKGTWEDTVSKASSATTAANADTLDNKHASDFATSDHEHATLTIGSKTYNGKTAVTVTAGDISAYTKTEIDDMMSGNVKYTATDTRPATGESGVIYIIPGSKTSTNNIKEEWMYINGSWEMIGTTETELSGYSKTGHSHDDRYYTKEELDDTFETTIPTLQNQNAYSVVKVNGSNAMSANTATDTLDLVAGDYISLSAGTKAVKVSTNLTFDNTPSSTNKVVTQSTIESLDGVISGTPGQGQTITGFSQTDGVVTAKFGDISITSTQISDFSTAVGNGKLTIKVNGTLLDGEFTANQNGDTEFSITVPEITALSDTDIRTICALV